MTEVWFLFGDRLQMYTVPEARTPAGEASHFEPAAVSRHLPELSAARLQTYAIQENVFEAVQAFRQSL